MAFPFILFWVILLVARRELRWRGVLICTAIWGGLLACFIYAAISPYLWVATQAVFDCILILVVFRGDIRIN